MRVRKASIVAIVLLFASTTGCVDKSVILLSQDLAAVQQVTTDELNKSIQQELPGVDAKTAEIYRRLADQNTRTPEESQISTYALLS